MVTFGRAAKQEERQEEEIVFPEALCVCVFFFQQIKKSDSKLRLRVFWLYRKQKPDELNGS